MLTQNLCRDTDDEDALLAYAEAHSPLFIRMPLVQPLAIPILMYHKVGSPLRCKADRFLNVLPGAFAHHLQLLDLLGYEAVTFAQAVEGLRTGTGLPNRPVCFTFDDAYQSIVDHALPLLSVRGWTATVFVPTAYVGGVNEWDRPLDKPLAPIMSWESLHHLQACGWEIAAHTRHHPHLEQMGEATAFREIAGSKADLEQHLGCAVHTFCYPFGRYNVFTPRLVAAAGFRGACTTHKQWATTFHSPLLLPRIGISQGGRAGFLYRLFVQTQFAGQVPTVFAPPARRPDPHAVEQHAPRDPQ